MSYGEAMYELKERAWMLQVEYNVERCESSIVANVADK